MSKLTLILNFCLSDIINYSNNTKVEVMTGDDRARGVGSGLSSGMSRIGGHHSEIKVRSENNGTEQSETRTPTSPTRGGRISVGRGQAGRRQGKLLYGNGCCLFDFYSRFHVIQK